MNKKLSLGSLDDPFFNTASSSPLPPSLSEVRRMFAPAKSLGAPESVRLAMDARLNAGGTYSLIQHSLEMGQAALPSFIGYGTLQSLSQNGLIRACVETVADDMTRAWIKLSRSGEEENKDLIPDLTAEMDRLKMQNVFHEAAELVGYEGGALIFLDTGVEGDDLLNPLPITPGSLELQNGGLRRLVVVDPVNVFPGEYNSTNPLAPDYYRPSTWWVLGQQVHASRLIRLVANECPMLLKPAYNFFGVPQAQLLWDYVMHFQECRVAEQRLLTKFSLTIFKTNLEGVLYTNAGTSMLDKRVRLFQRNRSNDGVAVIDKETEDMVKLETSLGGVTDIVRQSLELLAALNRTPAVKLLGISPSGFNATGESDIRNYYDHIASQQEKVFRDGIQTVLRAMQISLFGRIDDALTYDFEPLSHEDRAQLATVQKTKADTAGIYIDRGVLSAEEVRRELADDPDSGYANIENVAEEIDYPDFEGGVEFPEFGEGVQYPELNGA